MSESEAAWNALLDTYHFTNMDELDLVLLQGMGDGYFDVDALRKLRRSWTGTSKRARLDNSFKDAWGLFHNSFDDNEDELLRDKAVRQG